MKKLLSVILLIAAMLALCVFADEAKPVTVTWNGKEIDCASYGQQATIVEGEVMVPLRAVFEALDASVEWDEKTRTVTVISETNEIVFEIGSNVLYKNGEAVKISAPAMIIKNRTMIPAKAVYNAIGIGVEWDENASSVLLLTSDYMYNYYLEEDVEAFVPKTDLDREILAYAGGTPISAATVRFAVMSACAQGMNLDDGGTKIFMESMYTYGATVSGLAYRNLVVFGAEIENALKEEVSVMHAELGENYDEAFEKSAYTEFFYYMNSAVYPALYSKLYNKFVNSNDEELHKQALDLLNDAGYIRAKHILIQFPGIEEGREPTEDERTETLNKALEVLVKVNAMKDASEFDALVEEYNQDPGMKMNPDGYYFKKGEMVEPFEKAAYALEEGKTSSIIETVYGYHIIQRLPLEGENVADSWAYQSAFRTIFANNAAEYEKSIEIEYADTYDERVKNFEQEYKILSGAQN